MLPSGRPWETSAGSPAASFPVLVPVLHCSPKPIRFRPGLDNVRPAGQPVQRRLAQPRIEKWWRPLSQENGKAISCSWWGREEHITPLRVSYRDVLSIDPFGPVQSASEQNGSVVRCAQPAGLSPLSCGPEADTSTDETPLTRPRSALIAFKRVLKRILEPSFRRKS